MCLNSKTSYLWPFLNTKFYLYKILGERTCVFCNLCILVTKYWKKVWEYIGKSHPSKVSFSSLKKIIKMEGGTRWKNENTPFAPKLESVNWKS